MPWKYSISIGSYVAGMAVIYVQCLQTKRGNSDLQCLQSCVSMASEMEAVYLQDISATRPHFKAIRHLCKVVCLSVLLVKWALFCLLSLS